ncbi:DUF4268 domain-containing protein [Marinilabiliaceae bacterium JC040]|nr:DUF4268 domain-containing protein [Marinilabiliaceae bacterium JC040]
MDKHLVWERLDDKRACRIKLEDSSSNVFDKDKWHEMVEFLVDSIIRLERGFKESIRKWKKNLYSTKFSNSFNKIFEF